MKHYDEHMIELFVLESQSVAALRGPFDDHLRQCSSCRELYEELAEFHSLVGKERPLLQEGRGESEDVSLVIKPEYVRRRPSELQPVPNGVPARLWRFTGRNPIASSFSFVGAVVLMVLALRYGQPAKDTNPSYIHYNEAKGLVEVFNREGDGLWNIVVGNGGVLSAEMLEVGNSHTVVADLDGDGRNEVITIVPPQNSTKNTLRIFDAEGNVIQQRELGTSFRYNGESYISQYSVRGIVVDDFAGDGKKEIIVELPHYYSPTVIQRFDYRANLLGEYWHFGHFWGMKSIASSGGKKELILCGINDQEEKAVVAILDPTMLKGETEASATPGFSLAVSSAESHYISFPECDIDSLQEKPKPRSMVIVTQTENEIAIGVTNALRTRFFIYTFSKTFDVLDVKTDDGTRRRHGKLVKDGKIHSTLNAAYFELMKTEVRYWDGGKWRKENAEVRKSAALNDESSGRQ